MMDQYLSQMPPKALGTRPLDSVSFVQSFEHPLMPLGVPYTTSLNESVFMRRVVNSKNFRM